MANNQKKHMFKKLIIFFGLVLCATVGFAQELPERSNTLVTDYTNTLSAADKQKLEDKLVAFNDSTSTQIAVVMMKSTGNYDINAYGVQLLRKWGIGEKKKNNGILVLVAMSDRKMSIQTGYGAEGAVPDIITQEIIQKDMKPHFKQDDYYGGLDAATNSLIKYMKGEYKAEPKEEKGKGAGGSGFIVIIIIVVILILIFRNRGGGGGRQIIGRRGGASPFWWFLAGNLLGGSGRSSGSDWGGFSGGGGGGGGFGGFGGGSGGGGGSSGSW
jgi:uncharacterized protein